ncbi:MAG: cobyric acid synthase CobQ, partial [Firmicutes bacterium]|nr:cobyric acid synthase CobQ [Bacillota bacterium]
VKSAADIKDADIVMIPGTKNTIEDLNWMKQRGIADEIVRFARKGGMVVGICGGYQMLGERLFDPYYTESRIPEIAGLGLLDLTCTFENEKTTTQSRGLVQSEAGWLSELNGVLVDGYEIHMGVNEYGPDCMPFLYLNGREHPDGVSNREGNVMGTYLHGLFDTGAFGRALINKVKKDKGIAVSDSEVLTMEQFRERELNKAADIVRANLDMESVYTIIKGGDAPLGRWKE